MKDNYVYRVAETSWDMKASYGNHRFIVTAPAGDYVKVHIVWRRRDIHPDEIGVRIRYGERCDGVGCEEVNDVILENITRESGDVIFRSPVAGQYEFYYMPFVMPGNWYSPKVIYFPVEDMKPSEDWAKAYDESKAVCGTVEAYEARTEFDSYYPMEVVMTADERSEFASVPAPFMAIAESRLRSVRMFRELPMVWYGKSAEDRLNFADTAHKNEHYAFQVAIFAKEALDNIQIKFTDENGKEYSLDDVICFNLDGVDTEGKKIKIRRDLEEGEILPLWCGVRCENLTGDKFVINATVSADNVDFTETVKIELDVDSEELVRNGDDDTWRMGRLFWLNSDIGISNDVIAPYTPVETNEETREVSILGRRISAGVLGLPTQIVSLFDDTCLLTEGTEPLEIFTAPMNLEICENGEKADIIVEDSEWIYDGTMQTRLITNAKCGGLKVNSSATYQADGHIDFMINFTAEKAGNYSFDMTALLDDGVAKYMMGMCHEGGLVPSYWDYRWNVDFDGNDVWLGSTRAGIHIKLMQEHDHWRGADPLPRLWSNNGRGVVKVSHNSNAREVMFKATTGVAEFAEGQTEMLHFHMIVTPFHPIDYKKHWTEHYYHKNTWNSTETLPSLERAKELDTHTVIMHQGGPLNENINYPFLLAPELKKEIARAHDMGLKYKIYYTVRELTNYTTEIHALRALGDEIFYYGPHYEIADFFAVTNKVSERPVGGPWLLEHLIEGFTPAWHQFLQNGEFDCAIKTQSKSRWHNYYLQGLDWLMRVVGIDGIYLDGIGYDRHIMRRVRRVMAAAKPDTCDIDIHIGNENNPVYGSIISTSCYMEHFAYADSLWIGEGYNCSILTPDRMLTEVCSIPFGLMNEMLEAGGNPFKGMVYGMTARCGWSQGGTSTTIWRSVWDAFDIKNSTMYGYWHPKCPVAVDSEEVKATAYVKDNGEILICLGSWYPWSREFKISLDREALGIDGDYEFYAPAIKEMKPYDRTIPWDYGDLSTPEGFLQEEAVYAGDEAIRVEGGQGLMLFVRRK